MWQAWHRNPYLSQNWIQERNANTEIKPTPWKTLQSKVCHIVLSRNQSIQEELSLDTQISGNVRILPISAYNSSLFQEKNQSVLKMRSPCGNTWLHPKAARRRKHNKRRNLEDCINIWRYVWRSRWRYYQMGNTLWIAGGGIKNRQHAMKGSRQHFRK